MIPLYSLLIYYVIIFLLAMIITHKTSKREGLLFSLLGAFFFLVIYSLFIDSSMFQNLILASLLLLVHVLTGGYVVELLNEKKNSLYKEKRCRREIESSFKRLEEQNTFFKENLSHIIYRVQISPTLSITYMSPTVMDMTGLSPKDYYQDPHLFFDMVYSEDLDRFLKENENEREEESFCHGVIRLKPREDSNLLYLEYRHFFLHDEESETICIEGMALDVTKALLLEKKLRTTKERLELILESMEEALITTGPDGRINLMNRKGAQLTGYTREEAIGEPLSRVLPLMDVNGTSSTSSALNQEEPLILISKTKEKKMLTGFHSSLGAEEEGVVVVFRDTTGEWEMRRERDELLFHLKERVKELQVFQNILHLLQDDEQRVEEILQDLVEKIPAAIKDGQYITALIYYQEKEYVSSQSLYGTASHRVPLADRGELQIIVHTEKRDPLKSEERDTLDVLAEVIGLFLKRKEALNEKQGAERKLKEYSLRLSSILDASPAAIITQDLDGTITSWNKAAEEIFGYKKEEVLNRNLPFLYERESGGSPCLFLQILQGESIEEMELKRRRKDGSLIVINLSAIPLYNGKGETVGVLSLILDITKEKQAKEKIHFLHHHDQLTGLFNRSYIEEEIGRLENSGILPISVIIGDINGLRLINDAFGHHEGNRILMSVARILRNNCRNSDLIGRWGADEFILLLPGISNQGAKEISSRISSTDLELIPPISVSLATTHTTKEEFSQDLMELIRTSEDLLYREHQEQIQSARDTILSSMLKMLSKVSDETEEHTWRMQSLALEMGERLHLSEMELEQLSLLVSLHDIGKITIDREILVKTDVLTSPEWEVVKGHSEAGYLIAHSSEGFAHVADAILAHHEWWDGSGYPKGLKGGEIPLISRILSIIDSYDTMTQKRCYGDCISSQEAFVELKKGSGQQFDPHLIDVFISFMEKKRPREIERDEGIIRHPISARQQLRSSYAQIKALSSRLLHAQEEEMARLARDLHDDIGQNMTALKLDLELLGTEIQSHNSKLKTRLEYTINLVDSLIDHIRHQASALRPPVLDDIGLLAAIQGVVDRYQSTTSIDFYLHQEGMEERFSRDVETVLYRCIQESLTNVVRHAKASRVEITMIHESHEITTLIRDDGCGFELDTLEISSSHIGLTGMKERIQLINGRLFIQSEPRKGTEIFISVPI